MTSVCINDLLVPEILELVLSQQNTGMDTSEVCKLWHGINRKNAHWKETANQLGIFLFESEKSLFLQLKEDWLMKVKRRSVHFHLPKSIVKIIHQTVYPVKCRVETDEMEIFGTVQKKAIWEVSRCIAIVWDHLAEQYNLRAPDFNLYTIPVNLEAVESDIKIATGFAYFINHHKRSNKLNCEEFGLTSLPDISALVNLTFLNLSKNFLIKLPESIAGLTGLLALNLSENELTELPHSMNCLKALEALNLSHNPIRRFPHFSETFPNLYSLTLGKGMFASLPEGITTLPKLSFLDLDEIPVHELPDSFGSLTTLKTLRLRSLCFTTFPNVLLSLTALTDLSLPQNSLKEIPEEISALKNLRKINLAGNQLKEVPNAFVEMTILHRIDLRDNQISSISAAIFAVPQRRVYVEDNPLDVDTSILNLFDL